MNSKTVPKQPTLISEELHFAPRYVRSLEIERDLTDGRAVEGYVFTPTVLFAALSLATGLRAESTQRAWRITGPYGAGKSAFGLFLAHVAGKSEAGKTLLKRLEGDAAGLHNVWTQVPKYLPVPITGSRMPFGAALVTRLKRAVQSMSSRRPPKILAELEKLEARAASRPLIDEEVIEALRGFIAYATSDTQGGYEGVLLIIDEMGKFLEHAALRPDQADAHLFQRVAEMAAGSSKVPLGVVGFLHQNFADYAAGYGVHAQEEWAKVAQRFEDIPFDESLDQYGFLLARAMQYKEGVLRQHGIDGAARSLYASLLGDETKPGGRMSALLDTAQRLYPLHPTSFLALATAVKRFGQNQRSLFSFVLAGEAHGLQQYIHKTELNAENWYRLPDLFDYISTLDGISFRQGDRARKWELLKDTLTHGPTLETLEQQIVKTVGLLNVLDPVHHLTADARTISLALSDTEKNKDIDSAIERLVAKKILYFRAAQGDYCLWKHSSVDLESLREDAAKAARPITTLDDLLVSLGRGRAVIAHRHYQTSGTMRAFNVRYVSFALYKSTEAQPVSDYDGEILVVLLDSNADLGAVARDGLKHDHAQAPARVIVFRKIETDSLKIASEIRIWEHIAATCHELRVDDFARREVGHELGEARRRLEERLSSIAALTSSKGDEDVVWVHQGKQLKVPSRIALSRLLSDICDKVYGRAPIINNELINRHKLTSAIALARQRLTGAMITAGTAKDLKFEGNPPERTIYLSLFRESKLHRAEHGHVGFFPPRSGKEDPFNWSPVWQGLHKYLTDNPNATCEAIFAFLRAAPFGLREGPALPFLLAYILHQRRNVAVFERGTYLVDLTEDHVLRLSKTPAYFSIHLQSQLAGVAGLAQAYGKALALIRTSSDSLEDAHGIVNCIYRWYSNLTQFVQQTTRISARAKEVRGLLKRAGDPMDLLATGLPKACGFADLGKKGGKSSVDGFASELKKALEEINGVEAALRAELLFILSSSFGVRGGTAELRNHLESNFGPYQEILGDHKLKAALSRALDRGLADEAWLDSVAALLGERTLVLWSDETLGKFRAEAVAFAGQLMRWAALMLEHRDKKAEAGSLVRVRVTAASGKEHTMLVSRGATVTADQMKKAIRGVIDLNPEEAPLALAEALAELLGGSEAKPMKKTNDH